MMKQRSWKNWLLASLKGILAIVFGLIALFYTNLSIKVLATIFGLFLLASGFLMMLISLPSRRELGMSLWMPEGILNMVIGIVILAYPEDSFKVLMVLFGLWAIFMGLILLVSFYRLRRSLIKSRFILFSSLLSLLLGVFILWNPMKSSEFAVSLIGIFSIAYGIFALIRNRGTLAAH